MPGIHEVEATELKNWFMLVIATTDYKPWFAKCWFNWMVRYGPVDNSQNAGKMGC